jgi:hypothetical protein
MRFQRKKSAISAHLFEEVCCQHGHVSVGAEALDSGKISDSFLMVFLGRHDLEDMERSPGHIVPNHFKIDKLEYGPRLEVCIFEISFAGRRSEGATLD